MEVGMKCKCHISLKILIKISPEYKSVCPFSATQNKSGSSPGILG